MIFGINGTSSAISIALRVLLIPNSTGYPCYHSLIVGQLLKKSFVIVATLYHSLTISLFQDQLPLELRFQHMVPPNLFKHSVKYR